MTHNSRAKQQARGGQVAGKGQLGGADEASIFLVSVLHVCGGSSETGHMLVGMRLTGDGGAE